MKSVEPSIRKEFRRFRDDKYYDSEKYYIQPFNWRRLPSGKEVIVSFAGDMVLCPKGTVNLFYS